MDKLEALKKHFPDAKIEQINNDHFIVDGTEYSLRDDDELEADARKNIEETFEDYSDKDFSEWVKKWGGIKDFYNEVYVNDFRIEDSETYGDMSDEEILDELEEMSYFIDGYPRNAIDMEKVVDFVWDYDGAIGLSRIDGKLTWVDGGYTLIKED